MQKFEEFQVLGGRIRCFVDGARTFPPEIFPAAPDASEADRGTEFNAYLLEIPGQPLTLIDSGFGASAGAMGGGVWRALDALGITSDQIGRVIMTHLHGDHVGGLLDGEGLKFPNAEVIMHRAEAAAWAGTDTPGGKLLARVTPRLVDDGEEICPGVTAWFMPGHTAGHMGLRIGHDLVLVADICHAEAIQLADPAICTTYDKDAASATAHRIAALNEIADRGLVYCGMHQLSPKFKRLERKAQAFVASPA